MGDWERRVWCCASIGEILLIGEQLRISMHTANPSLMKDRRYLLRTYPHSFTGCDCVDWMIKTEQSPTREMSVILMNILLENNIIHHVTDAHRFKDENQIYRFRKDDGTFRMEEDLAIVLRGKRLFFKLKEQKNGVLGTNFEGGIAHKNSFKGCDLVGWMVENREMDIRDMAITEARTLLVNGVIKHVTDSHHFKDEALLYHFNIDYSRDYALLDLIIPPETETVAMEESTHLTVSTGSSPSSIAQDIPAGGKDRPHRTESGYHSDHHSSTPSSCPQDESPPVMYGSADSEKILSAKMSAMQIMPGGILMRKATVEELDDPHGPYIRRHIRINQDPVGFGFVIRGEGPVFVKTVDPQGPAAAARLRVGHYIYSVNDINCLRMHHKDLAHIILRSQTYCSLIVLEHKDDRR